jgi:hypothetical protein
MSSKTSNANSTSNTNNTNAMLIQQQAKKAKYKNSSKEDTQDGLMFADLLQQNDNMQQNRFLVTQDSHTKQNQMITQMKDEDKKSQQSVEAISQNQAHSIADIQHAQASHSAEFCRALQENHDKHNFEVNLPKIGNFRISTDRAGQKLNFSVSSKEKLPCDWLRTHQAEIEANVSKDLNMEVSLGITQDV